MGWPPENKAARRFADAGENSGQTAKEGARKAAAPSARSLRAAPAGADQYIAAQLKAIYDAVVEEPFLIGFSSLLDRLDSDAEK